MLCIALGNDGLRAVHDLRSSLRLRHADARLRPSDGAAVVAQRRFHRRGALPRPALSGQALSRAGAVGRSRRRRVRRTLPAAPARGIAARVRHVRGLRRGLCRADRICQADAAGDAGGRRRQRGLDLHLQLAGRRPAADRLGTVSGAAPHRPPSTSRSTTPFLGRAQHPPVLECDCSGAYSNQVRKSKGSPRSRRDRAAARSRQYFSAAMWRLSSKSAPSSWVSSHHGRFPIGISAQVPRRPSPACGQCVSRARHSADGWTPPAATRSATATAAAMARHTEAWNLQRALDASEYRQPALAASEVVNMRYRSVEPATAYVSIARCE